MWQFKRVLRSRRVSPTKTSSFTRLTLESLEDRRMMATLAGGISRVTAPTPTPIRVDPTVAWIDQNIQDASLRSLVKQLDADRALSRNDMIAVLNQAAGGGVTATEFNDLQDIVSRPDLLGMPDYVQHLADNIVNGDPANAHFGDDALGNLSAGSTGLHLNRLTSKWFRGLDRPELSSDLSYNFALGSLFGSGGPSFADIDQGALGDCWFMASLEEVALKSPSLTQNMFIDNGDNTYTVRFFHNGGTEYVTVDRFLPVGDDGTFAYANSSDAYGDTTNVLWAAFAEKAYAQLNESGWLGYGSSNSYEALDGGWPAGAMRHLTGQHVAEFGLFDGAETVQGGAIGNDFLAGHMVVFCSNVDDVDSNIVPRHCYAMLGYDAATSMFTLGNPWGTDTFTPDHPWGVEIVTGGTITLSTHDLFDNFRSFAETNPSQVVTMIDTILHTQQIPVVGDPLIFDLIPNVIDWTVPLADSSTLLDGSRLSSFTGYGSHEAQTHVAPGQAAEPGRAELVTPELLATTVNGSMRAAIRNDGNGGRFNDLALAVLADEMSLAARPSHRLSASASGKGSAEGKASIPDHNGPSDELLDSLFAELAGIAA